MPTKNRIQQSNLLNTKGDLLCRSASGDAVLPVGSDNQCLVADSSQVLGLKWVNAPQLLYINTSIPAGNTIANTNAEVKFASKLNLPANFLTVGRVMRFTAYGSYGTAIPGPTITFLIKYGSTTLCSGSQAINLSNRGWRLWAQFVVFSIGTSGTIDCQGEYSCDTVITKLLNTSLVTINTTTAADLQIAVVWGAASANNTVTLRQFMVETLL